MEVLYADPRFIGARFKAEALKRGFTQQQVDNFLARQEAPQLTKQRVPAKFFPIWGAQGTYQADLMFIDRAPVLCVIDVNTRYAYARVLKSKEATPVAQELGIVVNTVKTPMIELQTDNGSEFLNSKVQQVLKNAGVEHMTVEPGNHYAQGMIERFNQTLRRLITLYVNATGLDWRKVIDHLVDNYNHRVHSALGVAPADASDLDAFTDKREGQYEAAQKQFSRFKIGDTVRKLLNKGAFDKGRERWSHRIYTIQGIEEHRFVLDDDSTAQHYELQAVHPNTKPLEIDVEEKLQTKKKEGRSQRAQRAAGVPENKDEFDGSVYVGRRVRVPAWHFTEYNGNRDYVLRREGGELQEEPRRPSQKL